MRWHWRSSVAIAVVLTAISAAAPAQAQGHGPGSMGMGMGMARDSATTAQMGVIHELVLNHERITRTVTNLPDGGFGFVVARFGLFLRELGAARSITVAQHSLTLTTPVGIALIVLGPCYRFRCS